MSSGGGGLVLGGLFLAGIASSLHCLGMCGPLLLAFSRALPSRDTASTRPRGSNGFGLEAYHLGRLWTYCLLGFAAGWAGSGLRLGAAYLGWQRPAMILASLLVVAAGLATLGWIPGLKLDLSVPGTCFRGSSGHGWFGTLVRDRRFGPRLLLGAVMGLLPCGLIYSMLLVVATFPTPLHSAFGMLCFGLGTLPALTAVVAGARLAPRWLRASSPRLTAVFLIAIGLFMLARSVAVNPDGGLHHHAAPGSLAPASGAHSPNPATADHG